MSEQTITASKDGKTVTYKTVSHPPNSPQPVETVQTATRISPGPAGANKISGTWKPAARHDSENNLLFTFKSNGDGLDMTDPLGESYSAKFDGKDYPTRGSGNETVSLKRIGDHAFEETDKRDGKVVQVTTNTVSADGKKLTQVVKNPVTRVTVTLVNYKQ